MYGMDNPNDNPGRNMPSMPNMPNMPNMPGMQNPSMPNMPNMPNMPGMQNPSMPNMPNMPGMPATPPMAGGAACKYPDIYYKLQPIVLKVCHEMDTNSCMMPTTDMVERMADRVHDEACKMHPEMAKYDAMFEKKSRPSTLRRSYAYASQLRDRGLFRDFIAVLVLSELFGRRRRFY